MSRRGTGSLRTLTARQLEIAGVLTLSTGVVTLLVMGAANVVFAPLVGAGMLFFVLAARRDLAIACATDQT